MPKTISRRRLDAMSEHQLRRIPVVDDDFRIIGIICRHPGGPAGDNRSRGQGNLTVQHEVRELSRSPRRWWARLLAPALGHDLSDHEPLLAYVFGPAPPCDHNCAPPGGGTPLAANGFRRLARHLAR